jgi:hypothetical protein
MLFSIAIKLLPIQPSPICLAGPALFIRSHLKWLDAV